jgi:site-specific recombinase XerD
VTQHTEIDDFVAFVRLKNLSARTIEEYQKILNSLFEYLGGDPSPAQVTTAQLRRYVVSLQDRGLADKTVSNHVLVIKRFFGFLLTEGRISEDPSLGIPRPQVGERLPKALSVPETQRLFAAFDDGSAVERRDGTRSSFAWSTPVGCA